MLHLLLGLAILPTALAAAPDTAAANVDLVVNEILADPARDWDGDGAVSSSEDEWVEIFNRGAMEIDLSTIRLGDADKNWGFGFAGSLPPGGRITVYGSDSKLWQQANGVSAFGLRLANSGDTVALWQLVGSDTTLVDSYTYLSHEAVDDRASGRRPDGVDHWELFDGLNPYTGDQSPIGNGCAPTPELTNNCVTPVEETTWGELKARHR
jgi:hypothetical protein